MFFCDICGMKLKIKNKYDMIEKLSEDYIIKEVIPDAVFEADEREIDNELTRYPQFSRGYHECVVIFRKLCEFVIPHGIFFFHSAVVEFENNGYIFTGKSGTGKSTHAALWEKYMPSAVIVNGDKPLIKLEDDGFYAYSTPWCGKEMKQKNKKVRVVGVCFIEQAKENFITELTSTQVISRIFDQTVYMKNPELNVMLMDMINKFITDIPFYLLKCDMSEAAVKIAYNKMKPEDE